MAEADSLRAVNSDFHWHAHRSLAAVAYGYTSNRHCRGGEGSVKKQSNLAAFDN